MTYPEHAKRSGPRKEESIPSLKGSQIAGPATEVVLSQPNDSRGIEGEHASPSERRHASNVPKFGRRVIRGARPSLQSTSTWLEKPPSSGSLVRPLEYPWSIDSDDYRGTYSIEVFDIALDSSKKVAVDNFRWYEYSEIPTLERLPKEGNPTTTQEPNILKLPKLEPNTARIYFTHNIQDLNHMGLPIDAIDAIKIDHRSLGDRIVDEDSAVSDSFRPPFPWPRQREFGNYAPLSLREIEELWQNPNGKGIRFSTMRHTHEYDSNINENGVFGDALRAPILEPNLSWTSFALMKDNSLIILCSTCLSPAETAEYAEGRYAWGTETDQERRIQRIKSSNAFINFCNGSRRLFIQLFMLDLLFVNQDLASRVTRLLLEELPPAEDYDALKIGTIATAHRLRIEIFQEILSCAQDNLAAFEYIVGKIRRARLFSPQRMGFTKLPFHTTDIWKKINEVWPEPKRRGQKAHQTLTRIRSGEDSSTGFPEGKSLASDHDRRSDSDSSTIGDDYAELPDVVDDVRLNMEQHIVCANRLIELQGKKFLLAKEMRELDQTQRNYWLTALAAGFAPISLATGFLSMQTRLIHMGPVAYDFLGVMLIIVSLMFFMKPVIRYFLVKRPFIKQKTISSDLVHYAIEHDPTMPTGYDPRLRKKNKGKRIIERVLNFMLTKLLLYLCFTAIMASFLAGWITDSVRKGFLAMAYGLAGSVGFWLLINSPHFLYWNIVRISYKRRSTGLQAQSAQQQKQGPSGDEVLSQDDKISTKPTTGASPKVLGGASASSSSLQRNWTVVSTPSQEWDVERGTVTIGDLNSPKDTTAT
jgi:hypothetical protein